MNNDDRTGGGLCGNAAVVGFKYTYSENCTRWIIVCLAAAQPHRMAMRVAIRAAFRHDFPFPLLTGAGKRSITIWFNGWYPGLSIESEAEG